MKTKVFLMLLVAALLCLPAEGFEGANGRSHAALFSSADVQAELAAWDLDLVWFGDQAIFAGRTQRSIAIADDGTVYALAGGGNSNDVSSAVSGIVALDPDGTLRSVFQTSWGRLAGPDDDLTYEWAAIAVAGFSNALVDAGDLLVVRSTDLVQSGAGVRIEVRAVDPSDGDSTEIYSAIESWGSSADLAAAGDGTIYVRCNGLQRLDLVSGAYRATQVLSIERAYGGSSATFATAIGPDGFLYGHLSGEGIGAKTIFRVDPDGLDTYTAFATAPDNGAYTEGLTFDEAGKLWAATRKKKKSPPRFVAKMNKRGKFPWKKRIAQFGSAPDNERVRALVAGGDEELYASVTTYDTGFAGDSVQTIYLLER